MNRKRLSVKGQVDAGHVIGIVIAIVLAVLITSAIMPSAMDMFYETGNQTKCWGKPDGIYGNETCNTTTGEWGWYNQSVWNATTSYEDTSLTSIWWILPVIFIVVILLVFIMIIRDQL